VDERAERIGRNEALFRQVNERVRDVSEAFVSVGPSPVDFVCECGNEQCTEPIALTVAEYERVRSAPARFVVVPSHVTPEVETVVERFDSYTVVEKTGAERHIAERTDPRA
jgi:hypothetical protein